MRRTATLTGINAAMAEAASVVVGGRPWLQAWSVARLRGVCGRMNSIYPKERDETSRRNVAPAVSTGTMALSPCQRIVSPDASLRDPTRGGQQP